MDARVSAVGTNGFLRRAAVDSDVGEVSKYAARSPLGEAGMLPVVQL